jgi:hypothetical protein
MGVSEIGCFIGKEGAETSQDDKLCPVQAGHRNWLVLDTERGSVSRRVEHPALRKAAR